MQKILDMSEWFRFLLPIAFAGFIYAYHNDIQWMKENFNDIKQIQREMKEADAAQWKMIETNKDYMYQHCCSELSSARTTTPTSSTM